MPENNIQNKNSWKDLINRIFIWINEEYLAQMDKNVDLIIKHSYDIALAMSFYSALFLAEEDDVLEDYNLEKWERFFSKHTLIDCIETFGRFTHPEDYDPWGYTGYLSQLELLDIIIDEILMQDARNESIENKMRLYESNRP